MKNRAMIGLLSWLCCACSSPESVPHFVDNRVIYQQAVQNLINSEIFRQRIQRQKQAIKIDRAAVTRQAGLAAVASLFEKEAIKAIEIKPDSSFVFRFPFQEGVLGISTTGTDIIYLPDKRYWRLPNSRILNTTMRKNQNLENGWFQSDWSTNVAD